jgi:hypothetical protein
MIIGDIIRRTNQLYMDENDLEEACIEEQGNMSMVSLSLSK